MNTHLIETTSMEFTQRTYEIGVGVNWNDLTEQEKGLVEQSRNYIKEFEAEQNRRLIEQAYEAFDKLAQIEGLPEEAIAILKDWTFCDEEEEEEE